jgi:hypothetical protein
MEMVKSELDNLGLWLFQVTVPVKTRSGGKLREKHKTPAHSVILNSNVVLFLKRLLEYPVDGALSRSDR